MIKINLVPLKEKKKQQEYIFILIGSLVVAIVAAGMFWFYVQKIEAKRDLTLKIKAVEDESKNYEEKIAEINAFQQTQAKLDEVNKNIKAIQTTQKRVVFLLDQAAIDLPDGVWFTGISQGSGKDPNALVIDGFSFSIAGVKKYYETLVKTDGISKDTTLEIKSINAPASNDKQLIQYEVVAKMAETNS